MDSKGFRMTINSVSHKIGYISELKFHQTSKRLPLIQF